MALHLLIFLQLAVALSAPLAAWGFRDFLIDAWRAGGIGEVVRSRYARLSGLLVALILQLSIGDVRVLFFGPDYLAAVRGLAPLQIGVVISAELMTFLILFALIVRRDEPGFAVRLRLLAGLMVGAAIFAGTAL